MLAFQQMRLIGHLGKTSFLHITVSRWINRSGRGYEPPLPMDFGTRGLVHYLFFTTLDEVSMSRHIVLLAIVTAMSNSQSIAADLKVSGDSSIIPDGAKLETLWEKGGFTEGAAAGPDGMMYFSDFAQPFDSGPARVMKFDPKTGKTTVHCPDSKMGNGLMFNAEGRLFACCASPLGGARALVEITSDGKVKPIVERFKGKRFNSPNDLVIDTKGRIYFSDPKYVGPEKMELDSMNVYRYDPDGSLHRVTTDIAKPNGVILSPNGKTLYVAETDNGTDKAESVTDAKRGRMTLNAFPVKNDGTLGTKKVLVNFGGQLGIDGMTVDMQGHIYAAVRSEKRFGIRVYTPAGKEVAYIQTPTLPTNCCFGIDEQIHTLYVTAGSGFYRIKLKSTGHHSVARGH